VSGGVNILFHFNIVL